MPRPSKYANPQRLIQVYHGGVLTNHDYGQRPGSLKHEVDRLRRKHKGSEVISPVNYSGLAWDRLNDYDRIARFILAVAYSHDAGSGFVPQQLIAMATIAVAACGEKLYVAKNGNLNTQSVKGALEVGGYGNEIVVVEHGFPDTDYHAEMQLADYFFHLNMRFAYDTIGVSKPCCMQCANRLEVLGIDYSYWHDQGVGRNWIPCSARESWW